MCSTATLKPLRSTRSGRRKPWRRSSSRPNCRPKPANSLPATSNCPRYSTCWNARRPASATASSPNHWNGIRKDEGVLGDDAASWRWGSLHLATFEHPLANTKARAAVFNRGPVERGGDAYTPNRAPGPNYTQVHGASYRHILDFADWDRSVFTSVPGQSGQPKAPTTATLWTSGGTTNTPRSSTAAKPWKPTPRTSCCWNRPHRPQQAKKAVIRVSCLVIRENHGWGA